MFSSCVRDYKAVITASSTSCAFQLQTVHGRSRNRESSLGKFGVPKPVTGSQPGFAKNPCVPQLGFEPFVMSLNAPVKRDEYIYRDKTQLEHCQLSKGKEDNIQQG